MGSVPAEGAVNLLECSLGRYSSSQLSEWRLPAGFDVEGAARRVAEEPDVWTDGSLVDDKVSGVSSAGAGLLHLKGFVGFGLAGSGGHWYDDVGDGSVVSACRGYCSVPGPLQTVQRAELWGVILALQANHGVHLGVDNLGVVRHVGRILDGWVSSRPCELLPDGDLLFLFVRMLHFRGFFQRVFLRFKGHADEALIRAGAVRDSDRLGNNGADEAADFGRRRVPWWVIDARRNFFWCFAPGGVLLSLPCIVSLLLFLGLWLVMMVVLVLLLILLSGLLVVLLREDGLRCGIGLSYLDRLIFGLVLGLLLLSPLFIAVI